MSPVILFEPKNTVHSPCALDTACAIIVVDMVAGRVHRRRHLDQRAEREIHKRKEPMKKTMIALALVVVFALGGCGTTKVVHVTEPAPTTAQAPTQEPLSEESKDIGYIDTLAATDPRFRNVEVRVKAIELGHSVCEAFAAGVLFEDVYAVIVDSNFSSEQAVTIIGSAVGAYCPEETDSLGSDT